MTGIASEILCIWPNSSRDKAFLDQRGDNPFCGGFGHLRCSVQDNIRINGGLIGFLKTRHNLGFPLMARLVDALGISAHTDFQRALDVDFQESRNLPACVVAIHTPIGSRVKDNRYAVLCEQDANVSKLPIEDLSFLHIISGMRSENAT